MLHRICFMTWPASGPVLVLLATSLLSMDTAVVPKVPTPRGCSAAMPTRAERSPLTPPADFIISATANYEWLVNGVVQPNLTLTRGTTYMFDLTAFSDEHPFMINDQQNNPFGTIFLPQSYGSVVSFTPTLTMPGAIYYHCSIHYGMKGPITLISPPCTGDLNGDLSVNASDFGIFVAAFGTMCAACAADLNDDGSVNTTDFGFFVSNYGSSCD